MAETSSAPAAAAAAAAAASAAAADSESKELSYCACLPHLSVRTSKLAEAIAFYQTAFGADFVSPPRYSSKRKAEQQDHPPSRPLLLLGHLKFGSAQFYISEMPEEKSHEEVKQDESEKPTALVEGASITTNVVLHVVTNDVEAAVEKAKSAGAKALVEPRAVAVGRFTMLVDPVGFVWGFGATTTFVATEMDEDEREEK